MDYPFGKDFESEDTFCELCDDVEEIMSKVFEKVDA